MKLPLPPRRIDTHAHYITPEYREALLAAGHARPDGIPAIPAWDPATTLALMDRLGIETAMLSISSPGVHFGDDEAARRLARLVNEQGRALVLAHPGRFGLFAALPLPDLDGALAELRYAFDVLQADGVVLETNYHGLYLGDERLETLFRALDEYRAVVFIHPTSPACGGCGALALGYPQPMLEFIFDTTRAVVNLLLAGVTARYPGVRVIVPHGGAALPVVADRVVALLPGLGLTPPLTEAELFARLRRLYYDLAGTPVPRLLPALLSFADPTHLLYGSDYPFTPDALVARLLGKLEAADVSPGTRRLFLRENAVALFPRLAAP